MRKPEWVRKEGFYLVGVERYTSSGIGAIQEAWDELMARAGEIRHVVHAGTSCGFEDYSRDFKASPGTFPHFYYLAAMEVGKLEDIPEGMTGKYVPPATYALFRHEGPLADVSKVFGFIYQEWLPKSGFDIDTKVMGDFEHYPQPVTDRERAVVHIYVPVVPAASDERRRVQLVEQPAIKAAVIRSACGMTDTRDAWAKLRETPGGRTLSETAREGLVFIPEWQWATGVRELWTGVKVDSFDGLPEGVERLELPARLYARITVTGGREQMEDAYAHLNDWFCVSGYARDTAEGSFGFEANRLSPVNPFDIPADAIDSFDFDIYAPVAGPAVEAERRPDSAASS